MIKVFVSYRRDDSRHQAGRLFDHLVEKFGKKHVFKDVDSIPPGVDFREVLTERVAGCDVFLAVIGDDWLWAEGPDGRRRLDDPRDFVRIEIEAALGRGIPVIPVLVGKAEVPKATDLPKSLRELSYRNGRPVRPDPDFHNDVVRLVRGIKAVVSGSPRPLPWRAGLIGLAVAGALHGVFAFAINGTWRGANDVAPVKVVPRKGPERPAPEPVDVAESHPDHAPISAGDRPVPAIDTPPVAEVPVSAIVAAPPISNGNFRPLFNGKDLVGWKSHPSQPGRWHVTDGVLVGSGPAPSEIYTERGDFADFHLRVEARFNKGGSGGIYYHCPFGPRVPKDDPKWPNGFEATINDSRIVRNTTGGPLHGLGR